MNIAHAVTAGLAAAGVAFLAPIPASAQPGLAPAAAQSCGFEFVWTRPTVPRHYGNLPE